MRQSPALKLRACDGGYLWDESFYLPTKVSGGSVLHGANFFDPYRNWDKRGNVQPMNAHNLSAAKELYKTISLPEAATSYLDYNVWNTSVHSVVVAGNSTLVIETNSCPVEGCESTIPKEASAAYFYWSDNSTWLLHNETRPASTRPP